MKKALLSSCIFLIFPIIHSQEYIYEFTTNLAWSRQISVDSAIIPSSFTNANFSGSAYLFPDNDSGLFIYLQGRAPWWPEVYTNKICYADTSGNIKELKIKNLKLFNEREPSVIKGKNYLYFLMYDTVIKSDKYGNSDLLKVKSKTILDIPDDNNIMLCNNDSGQKLMGKSIPYIPEFSAVLYETEDFKKLTNFCLLPISSSILDDAKLAAIKDYYAVMLNNTILRGPDHHDLNIYLINKKFNKIWEHHLTGLSTLGRIVGDDITIDSSGNVTVIGYSNDVNVSFRDSNEYEQAYPDFTGKNSAYYFIVTYNAAGKMIKLNKFVVKDESIYKYNKFSILSSDNEELIFYDEWGPEIFRYSKQMNSLTRYKVNIGLNENDEVKPGIRLLFINPGLLYVVKIREGALNTNQPPVFKIEKRIIKYPIF